MELEVALREVEARRGSLRPPDYDGVIAAASVHAGRYQAAILDWVKHHATGLNGMPTAFVSVCLAAADDTDEARAATRDYIDDMQDDTGWTPTRSITVAGALQYREYDFVTRLVMRVLMRTRRPPDGRHTGLRIHRLGRGGAFRRRLQRTAWPPLIMSGPRRAPRRDRRR